LRSSVEFIELQTLNMRSKGSVATDRKGSGEVKDWHLSVGENGKRAYDYEAPAASDGNGNGSRRQGSVEETRGRTS